MITTALKLQIIEFRKKGYSMKQTAKLLGLTKGQVAGVLFRTGNVKKKDLSNENRLPTQRHG